MTADWGREVADRPRILVVDDSDVIRELIAVNLELEGFDVIAVSDGRQALEVVKDVDPAVITMDVVMPEIGGFEAVERLRADPATADIPVVIVTGRAQGPDRARAQGLGVAAYVTKPFEPAELVAVVAALASGDRTGDHPPISG